MDQSRRHLFLLCVLCGMVLASCSRDPQVRKQKYFAGAMQHLRQGQAARAVLDLRNALQVDPDFVEAANVLAELQARMGNYREAFSLLQRAEKTKPDYLPARKGLAQLYKLAGKLTEAQEEAGYILQRTPDDTDVLFLLGTIQQSQKKSTEAEGSFNRILEIQPSHVQALLALASIQDRAKNPAAAERFLKLAVERNPRSPVVYLALIKFDLGHGRPADAEALFPQALQMTGNNVQILAAEEGYYEGSGKWTQAEDVARKIQSSHPADPAYRSTLADFYVRRNDWTKAKTELQRVLAQHKDDRTCQHKLIEVELNLNELKSAESLNEALLKSDAKDSYAHLFKGRLYLASGDVDNALVQFNEAHKFQSDYAALYYWYAQAYLMRRQFPQARQSLETAVQNDPGYQEARLQLADLENQAGAVGAAMNNARQALAHNPADTRAMLLYSQSLLQKQQYADAARIINEVAKRAPGSADVHRQLGILELSRKNLSGAQQEFSRAWSLDPRSRSLLEAILLGYLTNKQTGAASQFLERQIQERPNDPLLYYEMGQVYSLAGRQNDAIAALQKALSLAPADAETALLLAQTYVSAQQPEPALPLLAAVMQKHARESASMLRAGILYEKLERWDDAQKAYEQAVQLDDSNAIAKNNLAWLLVSHGGNIDVALGLAQQAKEQLGDNVAVTGTLGWIYYKKQVYKTALQYLKECVARDQKNPTFQYELGMTYWKLGDPAQARHTLLAVLTLDPRSPDAALAREALAQF